MKQLQELISFVESKIENHSFPAEPANLYDPLRYFTTLGGKRMRPVLTLISGQLFGIQKEESIHAALCIELFHNFSLIHDDIMDDAPTRRGKTTVHEKWNPNIAILSGDVLFVEAYQQLTHYSDERLAKLLRRFNETAIEVCEGQQMDMDFETRDLVSETEYIEMIRLKTSVLLGCALEFGAILGRQSPEQCKLLYDYGVNLGIAFQIQDDILDLYADPEKFGKQVGGDILSNKKTLMLIEALKTNDIRVQQLLQMPPNQDKIDFAKALFLELNIKSIVEQKQNAYYDLALSQMNNLNLSEPLKQPLFDLAAFLIQREH
jgi:geranylgeranyl diphosphate synthase type II